MGILTEEELFAAAIQKPFAERAAFLDRACGHDATLRAQVEALLAAHDHPDSLLEVPACNATIDTPTQITERPGTQIGPYKLLQQIGEGGMGVVYMAEQSEPVQRKVALKVIKPGMDSRQVIARFEAERQALSMMDHVNIARVLDCGTTGGEPGGVSPGRPYFVMELVHGVPITKYCDDNRLTPRQRLELFVPVCQAIQHAHQKGIIHRDIKPSNVMVTLYDGKPVPKVIDFGVAKATEQKLTERTLFTQYGTMVGTLEYMSPEQAEMSALGVDTRSDIFSLGVLLYELLTGSTPLSHKRMKEAAYAEILRMIKEEEPQKPSTRLSDSGEALASISAQRNTEPAKLSKLMRGELDWIVMKTLEKDRNRRYETANGFAMDVQRYLADEAVQACPPSAVYRLKKFVRRNRPQVIAASLVFLALLAGIAGTTIGLIEARIQEAEALRQAGLARDEATAKEQARAEEQRQRVKAEKAAAAEKQALAKAQGRLKQIEKGVELFAEMLKGISPLSEEKEGKPLYEQLRERAEKAAAELDGEVVGDAQAVARLQTILGDTLLELGSYETAVAVLEKARATYERELGADHASTVTTLASLASAYHYVGKLPEAIKLHEQVRDAQVKTLGADHIDTLNTLNNLAMAYDATGKLPEAIQLHEQVRDARVKKLGADHLDTLTTLDNLAGAYWAAGRLPEAIQLFEQVRDARVKKLGADHYATLTTLNNLAVVYQETGKPTEAIKLIEQVRDARVKKLGADHPDTLTTLSVLAGAYQAAGKLPEAIQLLEQVRDARVKKLGADHPSTLATLNGLASVYLDASQLPEAIKLLEQVRDAQMKKLGADHPDTLSTLNNLAGAYHAAGNLPEAIKLLEQVRDATAKKLGADHPDTLTTLNNLAVVYHAAGKLPEAIKLLEQTRDARVKKLGADHPNTLTTLSNLASMYQAAGDLPEAIKLLEQVRDAQVKKLGADHPDNFHTLNNLAMAYKAAGRLPEAIKLLEQVRDAQVKMLGADHPSTLNTLNNLAGAYQEASQLPEAIKLYEQTGDALVKKLGADHPDTLNTLNNLAMAYKAAGRLPEALPLFEQVATGFEKRQYQDEIAQGLVLNAIDAFEKAGQLDKAEGWQRTLLAHVKQQLANVKQQAGAESATYAGELAGLGLLLVEQKKWAEAELVLREFLAICEKTLPDNWRTFNTKSLLGGALLGQKKYADAEPLLLAGYEGLKVKEAKIPQQGMVFLSEALDRLIELYTATDKPDELKKLQAARQIEEVRKELMRRNPRFDGQLTPTIENDAVTGLVFSTAQVTDISPVRALTRLKSLQIRGLIVNGALKASLQDQSPLQGMSLTHLDLQYNQVRDLTPLRGMPLEKLNLWVWSGDDLTPLTGMPLQWLNVGGSRRDLDLAPIAGTASLKYLCLNHTKVSDLTPLENVPLTGFECANTRVSNLTPLHAMRLDLLCVEGSPVTDFAPLERIPLKSLRCDLQQASRNAEILRGIKTLETINKKPAAEFWKDLEQKQAADQAWLKKVATLPADQLIEEVRTELIRRNPSFDGQLRSMTQLKPIVQDGVVIDLRLCTDHVSDISPVRALKGLRVVWFQGSSPESGLLTDLSPLKELALTSVSISQNPHLWDLSPLEGMPMTLLGVEYTNVESIDIVKEMPIKALWIMNTQVADLSPLAGKSLDVLRCTKTNVKTLRGLSATQVKQLLCTPEQLPDKAELARLGVTHINGKPVAEFWKEEAAKPKPPTEAAPP